jgi:hypothetical protein
MSLLSQSVLLSPFLSPLVSQPRSLFRLFPCDGGTLLAIPITTKARIAKLYLLVAQGASKEPVTIPIFEILMQSR